MMNRWATSKPDLFLPCPSRYWQLLFAYTVLTTIASLTCLKSGGSNGVVLGGVAGHSFSSTVPPYVVNENVNGSKANYIYGNTTSPSLQSTAAAAATNGSTTTPPPTDNNTTSSNQSTPVATTVPPPTTRPTPHPTAKPTFKPTSSTQQLYTFTIRNVRLVLQPVNSAMKDVSVISQWQDVTSNQIVQYWKSNGDIFNNLRIQTALTADSYVLSSSRRQRVLLRGGVTKQQERILQQTSSSTGSSGAQLLLTYEHTIQYNSYPSSPANTNYLPVQIITEPLSSSTERTAYIQSLQNLQLPIFANLNSVSAPRILSQSEVAAMNNGGSSSQANSANAVQEPWYKQYFIYLIIAACVVGLILVSCVIITFVCCRRRGTDKEDIAPVKNSKPTKTVSNDSKDYKRKKNKQEQAKNTTPYGGRSLYGGESSQDVGQGRRLNLRQSYTADSSNLSSPAFSVAGDASLMDPRPTLGGAFNSHCSVAGYGDQTVASLDYTYSNAFHNDDGRTVSTAGGTLGTAQRSMNDTVNSAMAGDNTVFSDEGTYDSYSADRSRNGQARSSSMNCGGDRGRMSSSSGNERQRKSNGGARERTIVVVAPPGKLGVVIDSSSEDGGDGMPMIHAVKDSSPVVGKLQVGDRVIAVDDEDVYDLSAIMVSKIISRKSSNPARRLTVIRTL